MKITIDKQTKGRLYYSLWFYSCFVLNYLNQLLSLLCSLFYCAVIIWDFLRREQLTIPLVWVNKLSFIFDGKTLFFLYPFESIFCHAKQMLFLVSTRCLLACVTSSYLFGLVSTWLGPGKLTFSAQTELWYFGLRFRLLRIAGLARVWCFAGLAWVWSFISM